MSQITRGEMTILSLIKLSTLFLLLVNAEAINGHIKRAKKTVRVKIGKYPRVPSVKLGIRTDNGKSDIATSNEAVPRTLKKKSVTVAPPTKAPSVIHQPHIGGGGSGHDDGVPTNSAPAPSPVNDHVTEPTGTEYESNVSLNFPKFQLTMILETGLRIRRKRRYLEDTDNEYKDELLVLINSHLRRTGSDLYNIGSLNLVNDDLSESNDGSSIKVLLTGSTSITAEAAPSESELSNWILNSFNNVTQKEKFISDLDSAGHETLTRIEDVTASLVVDDDNNFPSTDATVELKATNAGFMTGMIVGIFILTSGMSFAYHRTRRNKSRSQKSTRGYHLSDYYNDNDAHDEDANPTDSTWSHSPTKTLGYIAARSSREEINEYLSKITSSHWTRKKTSMSKLAAGATQEDFVQNGMAIDVYGKIQSKKKKKKGSPIVAAKKGAELDTDLDPIVEVNSSVADSVSNQTDDKMVKSDLKVPRLLPSLSSCPSDDSNLRVPYSPTADAPALVAMTPDTDMEDLMTPFDENNGATFLNRVVQPNLSSDGGSPVRKLSFLPDNERFSDKSSDSGVQGLLGCDTVVMSEEEALKANLITFVDENDDNCCDRKEKNDKEINDNMIRQTLGSSPSVDKENIRPQTSEFMSTILVLSSKGEGGVTNTGKNK